MKHYAFGKSTLEQLAKLREVRRTWPVTRAAPFRDFRKAFIHAERGKLGMIDILPVKVKLKASAASITRPHRIRNLVLAGAGTGAGLAGLQAIRAQCEQEEEYARATLSRAAHLGTADWIRNYTQTLGLLANKLKNSREAKQALRLLHELAREAKQAGRGDIWIPDPDRAGRYPNIAEIAFPVLSRALRKNAKASTKARAWATVRASERPAYGSTAAIPLEELRHPRVAPYGITAQKPSPKKTLIAQIKALGLEGVNPRGASEASSLLRNLMVAFPVAQGRTPEFLGQKVPGEMGKALRRTATVKIGGRMVTVPIGSSVIKWDEISPGDVKIGQGFTPMKFEHYKIEMAFEKLLREGKKKKYSAKSAYETALRYGLFEKIREEGIPAVLRGALIGLLGGVQQDVGYFPATTVDNIPIQRVSGRGFEHASDTTLQRGTRTLGHQAGELAEREAKLEKTIKASRLKAKRAGLLKGDKAFTAHEAAIARLRNEQDTLAAEGETLRRAASELERERILRGYRGGAFI